MEDTTRHDSLDEHRIRAEILLKQLRSDDPDWKRIGWDWAKPPDRQAWQRLERQLQARASKSVAPKL